MNNAEVGAQAVINAEIGDNLLWGIKYQVTIDEGTETKLEIADMIFGVNTEDHPSTLSTLKTKIFRWNYAKNSFGEIVQKSHLYARRGYPLFVILFLWDRNVWYVVDDKVVFAIRLNSPDREKWRASRPILNTWNSRVRVADITLHDFHIGDTDVSP